MIIVIGEILIDRFPDYERIGGAPFNFAFHLKQMGWSVRLITRIGDDADGRKIMQMLQKNGFSSHDVQLDPTHATGTVNVTLDNQGIPQFDICEDTAYDHIDLSSCLNNDGTALDMIYYGTLVQRTRSGFQQVQQFLNRNTTSGLRFCDINLRPPHVNNEAIEPALHFADILKLNAEELDRIVSICNGPAPSKDAIDWLMHTYNVTKVALTQGDRGSMLITPTGTIHAQPAKTASVIDTVGAGDAYASVLAAGTLNGLPIERTLEAATVFAASICGLPGAIPEDKGIYGSLGNEFERIPDAP